MSGIVETADFVTIREWLQGWNQQFVYTEANLPQKYTQKAVVTDPSIPYKRLLLEVFAYLSIGEIEQTASFVCKAWFHITRENELWKSMYVCQYQPQDTEGSASYRALFILKRLQLCRVCCRPPKTDQIYMKCPYYEMLVCKKCAKLPKSRIVSLSSYRRKHLLQESTVKEISLPVFFFNNVKSVYVSAAARVVVPYAERRKELLLEFLQRQREEGRAGNVVKEVQGFNLEMFYRMKRSVRSETERAVAIFCGKSTQKSSLEKSCWEFLQKLIHL